eukprot:jgi/Chlat1/5440/Chrsp36S05439
MGTFVFEAALRAAAVSFPKPADFLYSYGTAGFRYNAALLPCAAFRAGVLAALRARQLGAVTGVMITASHNPAPDNGIKLADPHGGMLAMNWEHYAAQLANAATNDDLVEAVKQLCNKESVKFGQSNNVHVFVARDTRPSGLALSDAAKQGVAATGASAVDWGLLTTPQLHFIVRAHNRSEPASEADYFAKLCKGFRDMLQHALTREGTSKLLVDAANGVGAPKLQQLQQHLQQACPEAKLHIEIRNTGVDGELNEGCGADFVQKERQPPRSFSPTAEMGTSCASIDGDADRVVYFSLSPHAPLRLCDGDRIAVLCAVYVQRALASANYEGIQVGMVQTAYANGASTQYVRDVLGLPVVHTPTGVKHLHYQAEQYDVGIYYESNGHGTVLFKDSVLDQLRRSDNPGCRQLVALSHVANQAVGDALSGILMVEGILRVLGWSNQQWAELYEDLPSRQLKVKVADRSCVVPTHDETRVVRPAALQAAIDDAVASVVDGRAFVRPSGTEDVVRVYAEARTQVAAGVLAEKVARAVSMHCKAN